MRNWSLCTLAALVVVHFGAASAEFADHDAVKCSPVAKEEMRPQIELQRKLTCEGWKVRQVKSFNGCYEVYGFDASGRRVEAFFHPKTFESVGTMRPPS